MALHRGCAERDRAFLPPALILPAQDYQAGIVLTQRLSYRPNCLNTLPPQGHVAITPKQPPIKAVARGRMLMRKWKSLLSHGAHPATHATSRLPRPYEQISSHTQPRPPQIRTSTRPATSQARDCPWHRRQPLKADSGHRISQKPRGSLSVQVGIFHEERPVFGQKMRVHYCLSISVREIRVASLRGASRNRP